MVLFIICSTTKQIELNKFCSTLEHELDTKHTHKAITTLESAFPQKGISISLTHCLSCMRQKGMEIDVMYSS